MPNVFRSLLESKYGRELFITSLTGEYVRIFPMPVWLELEEKLAHVPSSHPSKLRYLDRINYFGQTAELDGQGRVVIPVRLRETATMNGETMPALVLSKGSRSVLFYDLTTPPPVLVTAEPSAVNIADGSSWRHASVIGSYKDDELESILRFLREIQ